MNEEGPTAQARVHHLDADAVCAECGTVNPEDTLLCKGCGNNLRDQRVRRIAAGGVEMPEERPAWLGKVLAAVGIVAVVWAAANVGNIENWLIEVQVEGPAAGSVEWLWAGQQNVMFNKLLRQLDENPITDTEVAEALVRESDPGSGYDGRYFLTAAGDRTRIVAYAAVQQLGDRLYFVATLTGAGNTSGAAVRGIGSIVGVATPMAPRENTGLKRGETYVNGFGLALRRDNGSYEVHAETDEDLDTHIAVAYRVP